MYELQQERMLQNLRIQAEQMDRVFTESVHYVDSVTGYVGQLIVNHYEERGQTDLTYISYLLRLLNENPKMQGLFTFSKISWANEQARIIISGLNGLLPEGQSVDISYRNYVRKDIEEPWTLHLDSPASGAITQRPIIPAGMGVADKNGRFLGLLTMGFDIETLRTKFVQSVSVPDLHFMLWDKQMNLVLKHPEPFPESEETNLTNLARDALKLKHFEQPESGALLANTNILYHQLQNYPYILALTYDKNYIRNETIQMLRPRIIELASGGILLILLLIPLQRRVIRPIIKLASSATKISHGHESVEVPASGIREIDFLAEQITRINQYITERRMIEEQLREKTIDLDRAREAAELANRTKSEFFACMSHELRTPLNAVIALSEVLKQELFGPIQNLKYQEYIGDIYTSGSHLLGIINDILDLSKAEAGMIELRESEVALHTLVDSCIRLIADKAVKGGIDIANEVPHDLPPLYVDELRVKQAVLNLLSNAVKFTPEGGRVSIGAGMDVREGKVWGVYLEIRDTGIGMREEDIPKALSKFGQIDSGLERRFEGTGLGLPLAKQLAELHDGEILIESSPGKGTLVTMRFPASRVR